MGNQLTGLLGGKIDKPDIFFVWPSGVSSSELSYLANVSSDVQQQIDDISANVTSRIFSPLNLGQNTLLYGTSNLPNAVVQNSIVLNGLNVANAAGDAFNPIFCSELYTGGSSTSVGTSLTAQLAGKVNVVDVDITPTLNSTNLITSGGVYDDITTQIGNVTTSVATKHPLKAYDSVPTTNSGNFVTSGVICDLFNDLTSARTHQTMYPNYLYTQLGTAQVEVWHGWTGLGAQSFADIISHIGINSTNFYKFGADPGTGTFSYYTNYVPSIVYFGPSDTSPLILRNLNVSNYYMVRWSWVSYAPYTGSYTFRLGSDDGSRLQIRDSTSSSANPTTVCVMDTDQAYTTTTGAISLQAGRAYEFQLFWFEDLGGQRCTLEWQRPGDAGFSVFSPTSPCPDFNYFQPQFTVTKSGTGQYTITFGETCKPQSSNYTISLNIESITTGGAVGSHLDDYMIAYHSKTSSSFGVYIKEQDDGAGDGTFRDVRFDFICVSRGRIFCHGSVDGFTGIADVEYN